MEWPKAANASRRSCQRSFRLAIVLVGCCAGAAHADSEAMRAANRISTHIAGQATSLRICASVDTTNAAAYRTAAAQYRGDADIAAADSAARKILADEARRAGRSEKQSALAEQNAEAAVAASLRQAAAQDKARFTAECRDELRNFGTHSGSFAPLSDLFPYEMKLISASTSGQ
ncbi:MAG TPA: hypothetical protein VMU42_17460 [Candidatus Sulfotelmatobacter sp.]|nr:hypothetical protein [Candidatus Sulfotelmatobacter sp.]